MPKKLNQDLKELEQLKNKVLSMDTNINLNTFESFMNFENEIAKERYKERNRKKKEQPSKIYNKRNRAIS